MHKFYDRFIGGRKINEHKEGWKLYQKAAIYGPFGFNWLILILILVLIGAFLFPEIEDFALNLSGFIFIFLFLKFGEYKGYNECLYELENENK